MSKRVVSIALLLSISLPLIAQSISLEEIFSYTSKNALSLKMKQLDASIEKSNIENAESGYYPTFNGYLSINVPNWTSTLIKT